jgi:hypothetical protein
MEVQMPTLLKDVFKALLGAPGVSNIRRNHGLEHATLHILAERFPEAGSGCWAIYPQKKYNLL